MSRASRHLPVDAPVPTSAKSLTLLRACSLSGRPRNDGRSWAPFSVMGTPISSADPLLWFCSIIVLTCIPSNLSRGPDSISCLVVAMMNLGRSILIDLAEGPFLMTMSAKSPSQDRVSPTALFNLWTSSMKAPAGPNVGKYGGSRPFYGGTDVIFRLVPYPL